MLGALAASIVWGGVFYWAKQHEATPVKAPAKTAASANYSSQPQGRFPGLKVYDFDFLIPLNRLILTPYVSVDPPDGDYGKEGRPSSAFVFGIQEKRGTKWFLASGIQDTSAIELRYLGENIIIGGTTTKKGNGYYTVEYRFLEDDRKHESCVSHAYIYGEPPKMENDVSEGLGIWNRTAYRGNLDYFSKHSREQMFLDLQKAVARNDRRAVAEFFQYPVELRGGTGFAKWPYFTPEELVSDFDVVFSKARLQDILKGSVKDIREYRFGYLLPGGLFCDWSPAGESNPVLDMF